MPSASASMLVWDWLEKLELLGYLVKYRDKFEVDVDHVKKELGDILWFYLLLLMTMGSRWNKLLKLIWQNSSRKERGVLGGVVTMLMHLLQSQ